MESLGELDGSLVAVDTAPLIYFIEKYQPWVRSVKPFFQALDNGRFRAVTSSLTLAEVLVHPFRNQRPDLAAEYRQLLLGARNLGPFQWPGHRGTRSRTALAFQLPYPRRDSSCHGDTGRSGMVHHERQKLRVPGLLKFVLVNELPALPLAT